MSDLTVVIVPGAWHQPEHYSKLTNILKKDLDVRSKKLPSVNSSTPFEQTVEKDANFIRDSLLLPQIKDGKNILLVAHSYGGMPAAAAAKGLSKSEIAATGKKGGVIGLVLVCAVVVREGASMKSVLPGQEYDPWVKENKETGQLTPDTPNEIFYSDVSPAEAKFFSNLILPHAERSLSSPSPPPAWSDAAFDGHRAYVLTEQDRAIPLQAQQGMLAGSQNEWLTKTLNTSHSPFISEPETLSRFLKDCARAFLK